MALNSAFGNQVWKVLWSALIKSRWKELLAFFPNRIFNRDFPKGSFNSLKGSLTTTGFVLT